MPNPYVQIYPTRNASELLDIIQTELYKAPFKRTNPHYPFRLWNLQSVTKDKWGRKILTLCLNDDIYDQIGCLHLADAGDHLLLSFIPANSLPCKEISFLSVSIYMFRFLSDLTKKFGKGFDLFRFEYCPYESIYPKYVRAPRDLSFEDAETLKLIYGETGALSQFS